MSSGTVLVSCLDLIVLWHHILCFLLRLLLVARHFLYLQKVCIKWLTCLTMRPILTTWLNWQEIRNTYIHIIYVYILHSLFYCHIDIHYCLLQWTSGISFPSDSGVKSCDVKSWELLSNIQMKHLKYFFYFYCKCFSIQLIWLFPSKFVNDYIMFYCIMFETDVLVQTDRPILFKSAKMHFSNGLYAIEIRTRSLIFHIHNFSIRKLHLHRFLCKVSNGSIHWFDPPSFDK